MADTYTQIPSMIVDWLRVSAALAKSKLIRPSTQRIYSSSDHINASLSLSHLAISTSDRLLGSN